MASCRDSLAPLQSFSGWAGDPRMRARPCPTALGVLIISSDVADGWELTEAIVQTDVISHIPIKPLRGVLGEYASSGGA